MRLTRTDVVATLILAVLVCVVGTSLGVAASHVRSGIQERHGPLRVILPPGYDTPSIQRDRVRLHHTR